MASITYWPLDRHIVIIADYDVASVIVDVYDTLWWCSVIAITRVSVLLDVYI